MKLCWYKVYFFLVSIAVLETESYCFPLEMSDIFPRDAINQPLRQTQQLTPLNAQTESAVCYQHYLTTHFFRQLLEWRLTLNFECTVDEL